MCNKIMDDTGCRIGRHVETPIDNGILEVFCTGRPCAAVSIPVKPGEPFVCPPGFEGRDFYLLDPFIEEDST